MEKKISFQEPFLLNKYPIQWRTRAFLGLGISSEPHLDTEPILNIMKKQTTLTAVTLKTDLHLEVANDSFRRAIHMLSPVAREFIARRLREHAKQILDKADTMDGPRDGIHWIFHDNSVRFITANDKDVPVLDECHSEISHLANPDVHYIRYKEAFKSEDEDDREVSLFHVHSEAAAHELVFRSLQPQQNGGPADGPDAPSSSGVPVQDRRPLDVLVDTGPDTSSAGEFVNDTQGQRERVR